MICAGGPLRTKWNRKLSEWWNYTGSWTVEYWLITVKKEEEERRKSLMIMIGPDSRFFFACQTEKRKGKGIITLLDLPGDLWLTEWCRGAFMMLISPHFFIMGQYNMHYVGEKQKKWSRKQANHKGIRNWAYCASKIGWLFPGLLLGKLMR